MNVIQPAIQFLYDFISCLPQPLIAFLNMVMTFYAVGVIWRILKGL